MAGRKSHGAPTLKKAKGKARNISKSRSLSALSIAAQLIPESVKIRKNRLGTQEGGTKNAKHPRDENNHDSEDEVDRDHKKQRKVPPKSRFDELDLDEGSDSEGNEWKLGKANTDDESDIDSDEAFGQSDEEMFEGYAFSGSQKKPKHKSHKHENLDLNEDYSNERLNQSDGSDLGEDAVDLVTMLDDENSDSAGETKEKISSTDDGDSSEEGFGTSSSENDDNDSDEDESDNDETLDPHKRMALQELISSLSQPDGRNNRTSQQENVPDDQDLLDHSGLKLTDKLTLEDLGLSTSGDPHIRKSLKILNKSSGKSSGKLEVPLEKRQQDRLDRGAAYQKTKETLDRWIDTVKHNRRAEHISFPLIDHGVASAKSNTELAPVCASEPHNELEATIQSILEESGLATVDGKNDEDHIRDFEELESSKMSLDEVKSRRCQLRMARELLFREEAKSKRIKKIKSKSYRKVHRKQREKLARSEQQALEEGGVSPSEDEFDKLDRRRAEERMRARHKNSKWSNAMKESRRTVWDKDVRSGITEMAIRDEQLRKRVEGKNIRANSDKSDASDDSDDESTNSEDLTETQRALQELKDTPESGLIDESIPGAKLANMGFMRKADLVRKKRNDAIIEEMRRELAGEATDESNDEEGDIGRRVFGQSNNANSTQARDTRASEFEEPEAEFGNEAKENSKSTSIETSSKISSKPSQKVVKGIIKNARKPSHISDVIPDPEGGAWSTSQSKTTGLSSSESMKKKINKKYSLESEELDISKAEEVLRPKTLSKPDKNPNLPEDSDSDSSDSVLLTRNQELIKRAFSGANVVGEFEAEKKRTIKAEGDKVVDETLPGWGNWVGDGISKKELKRNRNRFLSTIEGVKAHKRKDAKLQRVIINEKKVKKNNKYLASTLPHPFESQRQYERSLRLPIGPEWTTKQTFQAATKPRVLIKQGIITPMSHPLCLSH